MATRRITAITMGDDDLDAVNEVVANVTVSGRLVVGDMEEADIPRLEERGVFVQMLAADPAPAFGALAPPPFPLLTAAPSVARPPALDVLEAAQAPAERDVYVVSVAGALLPLWADQLAEAGAEVLERVGINDFTARIDLARVPTVRALGFVRDLRLFGATDTMHPAQLAGRVTPTRDTEELAVFEAYLHPGATPVAVESWLREQRIDVVGTGARKIRFAALRSSTVLGQLARLPDVAAVEEFVAPRLLNDHARRLLSIDRDGTGGTGSVAQTGKGQVVAVADTGLDDRHGDFKGRIRRTFALGRPGDHSDPHGHGTHVAGSVLGDGAQSGGAIRGAAPEAELVFQSILDATGGLGGLPVELGELFEQARQEGAFIHNNSWGATAAGAYRINALEVDDYVWRNPDFLVVIAAGNSGTAARPRVAGRGFVDVLSVDAPGTAKNALTVGASRSDRRVDGDPTFGDWWPAEFPDPPIAEALITGDPESLAAFSGRGPCDEQIRMKPDVVAPGTFILSARSSTAPSPSFWGEHAANRAYAFMGGTSMAAPLVAGCAALVRQYFVDDRQHAPSAALLKAAIVNGTRWLQGADAVAIHGTEPNYHQGFGCVDLRNTIPDAGARLSFRDRDELAQTGAAAQYLLEVGDAAADLRVCLAWTDPPGRGLQNTLTVMLEHTATQTRWIGNPRRPQGLVAWDAGNNVQVIRPGDAPAGGMYRLQVVATNLLRSPQPFALVVTGALESELTRV